MEKIAQTLGSRRKLGDELLAGSKAAAWEQCRAELKNLHTRFARALDAHLRAEEDVLVAGFGPDTGYTTDAKRATRKKNKLMREKLEHLGQASSPLQSETYCDLEERPQILIPRHSLTEESEPYPMRDCALSRRAYELTHWLAKVLAAS